MNPLYISGRTYGEDQTWPVVSAQRRSFTGCENLLSISSSHRKRADIVASMKCFMTGPAKPVTQMQRHV
jgi:hypothetical protein